MNKAISNQQSAKSEKPNKVLFGVRRWKRPDIPLEKGYIQSDALINALWEKKLKEKGAAA